MTLLSVTAYHSFAGEVEASNTPTIRRLTPSCRHQLPRIARKAAISTKPCNVLLTSLDYNLHAVIPSRPVNKWPHPREVMAIAHLRVDVARAVPVHRLVPASGSWPDV